MPTFTHLLLFNEVLLDKKKKKKKDICIIWDYQKEGMFCSTCGKILLNLMAEENHGRGNVSGRGLVSPHTAGRGVWMCALKAAE